MAGIRGFADRWSFRRKLNLLVGVPLAVVAALLSYLIAGQVGQARDAASAADLVRSSEQVVSLVNDLESEHQLAILLSVRYEAGGRGVQSTLTAYRKAQDEVDTQIAKVRASFGDGLPGSEAQALKEVEGLTSLRGTVEQSYLPASNIDPAYDNAARTVIDGLGLDRNAELAATFTGNLLDSLLRADAAHGSFETGVFSATSGDTNAQIEFTTAVGAYQLYTNQAERFSRFATEQQADELSGIEHTSAQRDIAEAYAELQVAPSTLQATTPAEIKAAFEKALSDYPDYPEQAATRLKITSSLIGQIADGADQASTKAWWRAGLLLAGALLGFVLWLAFSVLVRRSVVGPVQALTGAAREVAEVAGRELARVADDDAEDDSPPKLREMPVTADDEIGELAEVFNRVQTTAIALLERQVLSRRNVAEMFGNVGRRVSNLTTRQLALIDAVERGETDPALLERLYSIDHIAVRLRRNADSLMLLAGIRETVLDSGPTALTNVVRAALGQIEGFQRVQLHARTEVMVEPDIIGDLTLMVAELLENAVSFSPADSPVEVYVRNTSGEEAALTGGASIVISDHGLGMSAERLAEENARLIRRERLDVVPTKVLGLFVVGTLARRWDVTVLLSRTPGGGMTAEVTVPSSLLLTMSPVGTTVDRGEVPAGRPAAELPVSGTASGPRRPAAAAEAAGASNEATRPGHPGPLPRRVPRREPDPAETPSTTAPAPSASAPETAADTTTTAPAADVAPTPHPMGAALDTAPAAPTTGTTPAAARTAPPTSPAVHATPSAPVPDPAADVAPTPTPMGAAPDAAASTRVPDKAADAAPSAPVPGPSAGSGGALRSPSGSGQVPQARVDASGGVSHSRSEDVTPGRASGVGPEVSSSQVTSGAPTLSAPGGTGRAPVGDGSSRPLRRRVRGATLRTTVDATAQQAARQAPRLADADAVRDALDEFEAAVQRAHRDSAAAGRPATTAPHDQNHLPEGAEQ
ncbi:ATP-binding protein [Streptomyces sp. TLI_185]|uniref:sensor histidine kinase n=1 Tax=Streptomyces sp. TLI_185 TaxID=2485151 RepID=UPI000F5017C7|nr:ATP-binding protein [Streptomyces sp. TLI_185]RPF37072.1 signal transduction histidine kinase [Streptomyces sp. TLI_185]